MSSAGQEDFEGRFFDQVHAAISVTAPSMQDKLPQYLAKG